MAETATAVREWYADVPRRTRVPTFLGFLAVGLFVLVFGYWANSAPIAGAVVTYGTFVTVGENKIIQHLEGGVIRDILIHEGDLVEAGQTLIRLDETAPKAELERLVLRRMRAEAMEARLLAEINDEPQVIFPPDLLARQELRDIQSIISAQQLTFEAWRKNLDVDTAALKDSISAIVERINAAEAQKRAVKRQIELIEEELAACRRARAQARNPRAPARPGRVARGGRQARRRDRRSQGADRPYAPADSRHTGGGDQGSGGAAPPDAGRARRRARTHPLAAGRARPGEHHGPRPRHRGQAALPHDRRRDRTRQEHHGDSSAPRQSGDRSQGTAAGHRSRQGWPGCVDPPHGPQPPHHPDPARQGRLRVGRRPARRLPDRPGQGRLHRPDRARRRTTASDGELQAHPGNAGRGLHQDRGAHLLRIPHAADQGQHGARVPRVIGLSPIGLTRRRPGAAAHWSPSLRGGGAAEAIQAGRPASHAREAYRAARAVSGL